MPSIVANPDQKRKITKRQTLRFIKKAISSHSNERRTVESIVNPRQKLARRNSGVDIRAFGMGCHGPASRRSRAALVATDFITDNASKELADAMAASIKQAV